VDAMMKNPGYMAITKAEFYRLGGLRNSSLFRKADKRGRWRHYMKVYE
jgi:hypothetical protein